MNRPIVFLSDYGTTDDFVGVCHGVIAGIAPDALVIDLTHGLPRHDVLRGAITLARSARFMPEGAVHLAVVDPDVGTARRGIAVECARGQTLVGPDNGLLSLAWAALGGAVQAVEITSERVLLRPVSHTFHGRDVFAPAAAHLSTGVPLDALGPTIPVTALERVSFPDATVSPGRLEATVIGVDGFGNVQLSAGSEQLSAAGLANSFTVGGRVVPLAVTFAELEPGTLGAVIDGDGFVALAVDRGNAAELLGLAAGDRVVLD